MVILPNAIRQGFKFLINFLKAYAPVEFQRSEKMEESRVTDKDYINLMNTIAGPGFSDTGTVSTQRAKDLQALNNMSQALCEKEKYDSMSSEEYNRYRDLLMTSPYKNGAGRSGESMYDFLRRLRK